MSQHLIRSASVGAALAAFVFSMQALSQSTSSVSVGSATTLESLVSALTSTSTGFSDNGGVLTPATTPVLSGPAFSAAAPAAASATATSSALATATGAGSANVSNAATDTTTTLVAANTLLTVGAANPALPLNCALSIFVSDVDTTAQLKFSEVLSFINYCFFNRLAFP